MSTAAETRRRWERHDAEWRDPAQVVSQWEEASRINPALLRFRARGAWWEIMESAGITLLVTREYEHLLVAICTTDGGPRQSYVRLPHPSGLAVDRTRRRIFVASTRNPNQVYEFARAVGSLPRRDAAAPSTEGNPLLPVRCEFYPGSLYIHDLALVGGRLHANAVGLNAVVQLDNRGYTPVWWPRCVETAFGPDFTRNYLQLNSIAAGADLQSSYFSASGTTMSRRRPGHRNFPVDRRGVIFSGRTREPVASGLTRPHSARFHDGKLWVDNSGYGELVTVESPGFHTVARLPGWTRGLAFHDGTAFVATSRVIPRFRGYAPGLDVERSVCGVHAVDATSGAVVGSLIWPEGNQIFSVEWVPREFSAGFPHVAPTRGQRQATRLFYSYAVEEADDVEE